MKIMLKFLITVCCFISLSTLITCNKFDPEIPKDKTNKLVVTTNQVSNVGFNQATVYGNVSFGDLVTMSKCGFVWSRQENPDINNFAGKYEKEFELNAFSCTMGNLSENITYYVRAFATSSEKTVYGQQLTFTTIAAPRLTTTDASQITGRTAVSGGNILSDGGYAITYRGVCWSTSQNPSVTNPHTTDGSGIGSYTSEITNLSPSTIYYVRSYATNSLGTTYGNQISFTTEESTSIIDIRDGNEYETVQIGEQIWMAENLKYLPYVHAPTSGSSSLKYYYVYNYNGVSVSVAQAQEKYNTYGVLYNWPAAQTACPLGWHLPTDNEWTELINYLGGSDVAGGKLKETETTHWNSPNTGATNESGFTAIPGGYRNSSGVFSSIGNYAYFWSSTPTSTTYAYDRRLNYNNTLISHSIVTNENGFSVRCVKD